jgi:hypothetical protein
VRWHQYINLYKSNDMLCSMYYVYHPYQILTIKQFSCEETIHPSFTTSHLSPQVLLRKDNWEKSRAHSKMLQSTRNLITHLYISKPSYLQRLFFTTTCPNQRKHDPRYPDEEKRKAAYRAQALLHQTRYHSDPAYRAAKKNYTQDRHARLYKQNDLVRLLSDLHNWVMRYD